VNEPLAFATAVFLLLVTPGPTNTLLATAGATSGFRRAVPLLAAELGGYLVSVSTLMVLLGPEIATRPALGQALRLASAGCLIFVAARLWGTSPVAGEAPRAVTFRHVFFTTLLNPKGLVFAFAIFPPVSAGARLAVVPWLGGFSVLTVAVGTAWIALGTAAGRPLRRAVEAGLVRRFGAGVVGVFGLLLAVSVCRS
jgi:threonine/homoserine/homoserine lactone efflux protein